MGLLAARGETLTSSLVAVLWSNRLTLCSFFFVALMALVLSVIPTSYWEEGGKWIVIIPYGFCITIGGIAVGLSPWLTKHLPLIVSLSLLLLVSSIWYDTAFPGTFAELQNRAAGFPGNANFAALVAVLLCAATIDCGDGRRQRSEFSSLCFDALILLLTFSVVTMTMSRSGLVNFAAVVSLAIYFRLVKSYAPAHKRAKDLLLFLACGMTAMFFVIWFGALSSSTQGSSRLTRFLNNQQVDDGSAGTRLAAAYDSIRLIEESPLIGHGTGFARTMNELPHNLYLQQWVNNGIFGVGAYLIFLLVTFLTFVSRRYRNGQALIAATAVGSAFSHNLLDQRPFLLLLGILLSHSCKARPETRSYTPLVLREESGRNLAFMRSN